MLDRFGRGLQDVGVIPDYHVGGTWKLLEARGARAFDGFVRNEPLRKALEVLGSEAELGAVREAFYSGPNLLEDAPVAERNDRDSQK